MVQIQNKFNLMSNFDLAQLYAMLEKKSEQYFMLSEQWSQILTTSEYWKARDKMDPVKELNDLKLDYVISLLKGEGPNTNSERCKEYNTIANSLVPA